MASRYISVYFRHLATDWFALRQPQLKNIPFIVRRSDHNRMVVAAVNAVAMKAGVQPGMVLADARITVPGLEVADEVPELYGKLLTKLALWCIRFTPIAAIDLSDGLILDASGCAHLWGGEEPYVKDITDRLSHRGYDVRVAMADTVGAAWAIARYGKGPLIVPPGQHIDAVLLLPPQALRLDSAVADRLIKLGLRQIKSFIRMPRPTLRRRFGPAFISQVDKAIGQAMELIEPVQPAELYQERVPCLEPILTATGIQIALEMLLGTLCERLKHDQLGLREAIFCYYRVDGKTGEIRIGTNQPSNSPQHLFRLFDTKLDSIEPDMGIELFVLTAPKTEVCIPQQEAMWKTSGDLSDVRLSEFIDRIATRVGTQSIQRFLPDEHHWPDRSFKATHALTDEPATAWSSGELRPFHVLKVPQRIEVSAPIPDYPPMVFQYLGKVHTIRKADGPERIEPEWMQPGNFRDYYRVEDTDGRRYWLFREGPYNPAHHAWFLHGFFA